MSLLGTTCNQSEWRTAWCIFSLYILTLHYITCLDRHMYLSVEVYQQQSACTLFNIFLEWHCSIHSPSFIKQWYINAYILMLETIQGYSHQIPWSGQVSIACVSIQQLCEGAAWRNAHLPFPPTEFRGYEIASERIFWAKTMLLGGQTTEFRIHEYPPFLPMRPTHRRRNQIRSIEAMLFCAKHGKYCLWS